MSNSACGTQSLYNLSIADRTRNRERSCLLLWRYLQYIIVENAVIIEPIVLLNLKPTITTVRRAAALGHKVIIIYYAHLVVPGKKFWKVWIGSGGEQQLDHGMI